MKRKIFSILFALVLACSLGMVTAVPASAEAGYSLHTMGTGIAEWSTEANFGSYSVKLDTGASPGPADFARIIMPIGDKTLSEVASVSYWAKVTATAEPLERYRPWVGIYLDDPVGGDGDPSTYEYYIQAEPMYAYPNGAFGGVLNTWEFWDSQDADHPLRWMAYEVSPFFVSADFPYEAPLLSDYIDGSAVSYTTPEHEVQSFASREYGSLTVIKITFTAGYGANWENFTGYVDDITINTVPYELEWTHVSLIQVDDDREQFTDAPFQTIQGAVDCASPGDTINVAEGMYAGAKVDRDVTITGAADGASVITSGLHYEGSHPTAQTAFLLDADADGAEIRNFTINCNASADFYFGVFARGADNVIVDSLAINHTIQGISNWGGNSWQITNNVIDNTEASGGGGISIFLGAKPEDGLRTCSNNLVQKNTIDATATAPTYSTPGICLSLDTRSQYNDGNPVNGSEDVSGNQILDNIITSSGVENTVGIEVGTILGNSETDPVRTDPEEIAALMAVAAVHDNLVQGNDIDGAETGVYFYNVTDLTVTQNEIANCIVNGIYVEHGHSGVAVNYNNIYGNACGLENDDTDVDYGSIDAENNWWGSASGPSHASNTYTVPAGDPQGNAVSDLVDFVPWLDALYDTGVSFAPVTTTDPVDSFASIQAGVSASNLNGTVNVANGRYAEQIVIGDSLTLMGESRDDVIIDGSSFIETNIKGVWINSSNVTVKNLTVKNFGPQWCYSILAIEQVDSEGGAHPVDIANEDKTLNPLSYVKIENVKFDNNATGPYLVYSQNSTVQDCFITDQLGDGIWMSWGCDDARIIHNEVINSGNQGIWLGRHWRGSPPVTKDGVIQDNTVNGALEAGIWFAGDGCTIENNEVMNIQGAEWSNGAITLGVNAATSNVVVRYNKIHDNSTHGIGISATSDVTQTHINFNNIHNNIGYGLKNETGALVDATYNWWGDVAGPETVGAPPHNPYTNFTGGNAVSDYVDYLPWLIQIELVEGWNIWSDPITVDEACLPQLDVALTEETVDVAYYFDSTTQDWWNIPEDASLMDAWYIKMLEPVTVNIWASSEATFPWQKEMKVGWNFVGLAELCRMPAPEALASALYGTGEADLCGYSQVISPSLNGASWTYLRETTPDPMPTMVPTKGYWVFMVNDGVLGGFSSTPIVEVDEPLPGPNAVN